MKVSPKLLKKVARKLLRENLALKIATYNALSPQDLNTQPGQVVSPPSDHKDMLEKAKDSLEQGK